jgi:hypothetical protein
MKNRKQLNISLGWYKNNPLNILRVSIGEVIEDVPSGWLSIVLFQVVIGKLEFSIMVDTQ